MISKGMKGSVMLNKFSSSALQAFLSGCVNLSSHVTIKESGQIKGGYFYTSQFSSGDKIENHEHGSTRVKQIVSSQKLHHFCWLHCTSSQGKEKRVYCLLTLAGIQLIMGTFHSSKNSGNFSGTIKWNGPFWFDPTGIFGTSFEGCPLGPVRLSRSAGPKRPFPFDKIVVPSTTLLYPTYKNNNQTRGGLGRVCATGMYCSTGHVEFPKFQTGIFVELTARYN